VLASLILKIEEDEIKISGQDVIAIYLAAIQPPLINVETIERLEFNQTSGKVDWKAKPKPHYGKPTRKRQR
jgi:hypothetical protein